MRGEILNVRRAIGICSYFILTARGLLWRACYRIEGFCRCDLAIVVCSSLLFRSTRESRNCERIARGVIVSHRIRALFVGMTFAKACFGALNAEHGVREKMISQGSSDKPQIRTLPRR